ncbi:MAG: anaerobic ribonucleoside-triphosphate reductase [Kiritimatiellae bacterium]|nr:anaerobic ribonucleoside-triphosphate reductase [Kiritimatiellia bacterium]MBQ3345203.1 anaerobic ribonucleoside-triphosphate reductase [Kiritimatiellia bacterium]MBQ6329988.1 anaerobic ribonucleoside-triphosphate reductase [Kiritimatiellia bacterium]
MNIVKENSAVRDTHAGRNFAEGARAEKARVLAALPQELADLHRAGVIHIHDLDGWNDVGNCSTPLPESYLRPGLVRSKTDYGKIADVFEQVKSMIYTVGQRQTGGIGCGNFDRDMAAALVGCGVAPTDANFAAFREEAVRFFSGLSTHRLRNACENFYVTLNMGLDTSEWGRAVTRESIAAFESLPGDFTRPNIVFKVKRDINGVGGVNHDLFQRACACTAKKMIPTYLLMDSKPNADCDPWLLNIMGCRTRVYANRNGNNGSVGRGNIAAVSVNLPRIALESQDVETFLTRLAEIMDAARRVLILRAETLKASHYLAEVADSGCWHADNAEDICRQGTYSVGFIGVSEAVEMLGEDMLSTGGGVRLAENILEAMRGIVDGFSVATGLNFALLASPGEGISGRFADEDSRRFPEAACWRKGFYTNSFHISVDSGVSIARKLSVEGPFHRFANGGSISYVELREAPIGNIEAISDIVGLATACGVSYLGVNFPLDLCNECGTRGTFDVCPNCGSTSVKRIRRVSGYLEVLDEFATGKKFEESLRRANG